MKRFDPDLLRPWLTLAAILGTLGVNLWSNLFPINGLNIGKLSNTLFAEVQIIPANYAFAIWGLIYLGLIAFGIYQLLPAQRQNSDLRPATYLLILACVAQCIWVILFLSRLFVGSVVAMVVILLALIGMYLRLGIGQRRVSRNDRWFLHIPISIYLGWITVATVVNVASALYSLGWNGWGLSAPVWSVMLVLVSGAIAALVAFQRRDVAFVLVIVWALVAIVVRQLAQPLIAAPAAGVSLALLLLLFWQSSRRPSTA
ncbi:MAG: tryptophan-rich sensory protein [Leptolyngbyaceae bacterium]|nr:tryptophan-rich sensory protein [Leptolyngbyaceae bacterium]